MSEKARKENINTFIGQNKSNYINNCDNINRDYNNKKCYFKYINNNEDTPEDYTSDNDNKLGNFTNFLNRLSNVNFENLDIETDSSNEFNGKYDNDLQYTIDSSNNEHETYVEHIISHPLDNKNYEYISNEYNNGSNEKYDNISDYLNKNYTNSFENYGVSNKKYKKNSDYSNDTIFLKNDGSLSETYKKTSDNSDYENSFKNNCQSHNTCNYNSEFQNYNNSLSVLKKLACKKSNLFDIHLSSKKFIPPQNDLTTALKHLRILAAIEYNRIIKEEKYKAHDMKSKIKKIKPEIKKQTLDLKKVSSFNDFSEDIFIYDKQTKMYKCPENECNKKFPNLSRSRRHYITHTDIKPFKCENSACNRIFSRKDNMLQHLRVHCPYTKK